MKRSKSTISEEIKRRKYNGKYSAQIAQNRAEKRRVTQAFKMEKYKAVTLHRKKIAEKNGRRKSFRWNGRKARAKHSSIQVFTR